MKVDLKKGFDSIHWEFIAELLIGPKFLPLFIKWIMICISSTSFTIDLNGGKFGFFEEGREVRQGVPLSPLPFVLTMKFLLISLNLASGLSGFKFHIGCKKHISVHRMF